MLTTANWFKCVARTFPSARLVPQYFGYQKDKPVTQLSTQMNNNEQIAQRKEVLKTYLQIIPPYRLQQLLQPQKTDLSAYLDGEKQRVLSAQELKQLHKKMKKSAHMVPVQVLGNLLEVVSHRSDNEECRALSKKVYGRIMNTVNRKINVLTLSELVDFMYKLVKLGHKEFEFMKEVERIIIEQKIKISYPLIRKILWSFTHLDAGSAVLYAHISKTLKIGQHEFSPLELAESAYMLSKASQNATGGYGVFLIAEKHLLSYLPRLQFHDLVKAASFMLAQNIGSNQFQTQLQAELYKKYPDRSHLRINDLVMLLKATSAYYFKYKEKALLNMLQASTRKMAPEASLQQFEDILWSWGRAGKGDRQMWEVLQNQVNLKFKNLLKPRQVAFFYYSVCSNEHSSPEIAITLQQKFMKMISENKDINEHYLLKFLLGMQKRKNYPQKIFSSITQIIGQRLQKLSVKQLVTFAKVLNESDLCYENKQAFKGMEASLMKTCKTAIGSRIYMFRMSQLVQLAYMWIKLDVEGQSQPNPGSSTLTQELLSCIGKNLHQIPKSSFIKALFCYTIKDKYKQAVSMIGTLEQLMKYGPVSYFFSPLELPLAAYCIFHLVLNSGRKIRVSDRLVGQLGSAMDNINPTTLNKFVRNGYEECMRLKAKL